jgi:hypothetical protein
MTAHYRRARSRLDKLARSRPGESPLHPQFVAAMVDRLAAANGALSFVELEMKAAGIVTYGTDLDNPDFAGIAQAAAQAELRRGQGLHAVRDQDRPVRRGQGTGRAGPDQPAGTGHRVRPGASCHRCSPACGPAPRP